jgi:hypothetical protein
MDSTLPGSARLPQHIAEWFVVADVRHRDSVGVNAIPQRGRRMMQRVRAYLHSMEIEMPFGKMPVSDLRRQLT